MFKIFFYFYIKLVFLYMINQQDKIKSFVQKSNLIMKEMINDMILLEILPIDFAYVEKNENEQIPKLNCIYCYEHLIELNLRKFYIFKYMFNESSDINLILICKKCLLFLMSVNKNKSLVTPISVNEDTINHCSDTDQQANSTIKRKLSDNETNNNSFIYEWLSTEILNSFNSIKFNIRNFKDKNYQIITLYKIFRIKVILNFIEKYEHISSIDYIYINNSEKLKYHIFDRFTIQDSKFDLRSELFINHNLYYNFKMSNLKGKNLKLEVLQKNIDNGRLLKLFDIIIKKQYIWSNDIYFNLITLNEVSKNNEVFFNQLGIKSNYSNVANYIRFFENFNDNIKKIIQIKFSEICNKFSNYAFIIEQLFDDIELFNAFNKTISHLYDKKQFINTIIEYHNSDIITKKKYEIIVINNNILNFEI